jgi:murein L,D-transpeptidase YafK
MKIITPITVILILISQVLSQNRKDLIWEYNKLLSNDYHLGILLDGNVNAFTNQEIATVLDSAWAKKKTIILLQVLGYLENPVCELITFSDLELNNALLRFKHENDLSSEMTIGNSINQILFNKYLNSNNKKHLPYLLRKNSLDYQDLDILFVVYKSELEFQVWAKKRNMNSAYALIASYPITDPIVSKLGPKTKYGDTLTPEGFYSVNFYSSFRWSDYYLAFRVSYPNTFDHTRRTFWGVTGKAGGDINIHGCCVSIGCIPLGNPVIEEVFLLARTNQINGSDTKIMIFPFKFDNKDTRNIYWGDSRIKSRIKDFWNSLEVFHKYFIKYSKIPNLDLNPHTGYYILNGP